MAESQSGSTKFLPGSIEDKLMGAARSGDIEMLYRLIGEDEEVLKRIKKMKFVDTPLHIAAAEGKTDFAMEIMYLKKSFATKLNKHGLSPLHLALQNGHTKLALSLLKIDESLVSVKGKKGFSPLHFLVMKETNRDDLIKFLKNYPQCIDDVTSRNETALHVAAKNNNVTALRVLLRWLRRTNNRSMLQKQKIINATNRDSETVLHIEVSNPHPDPEAVSLLTKLRINTKAKNWKNQTALDILEGRTQEDSCNIWKCLCILRLPRCLQAVGRIPSYLLEVISQWGYEIKHMSADRGNALLVVTVLILTATYQATLSPPGGVLQANAGSNDNKPSSLQVYFGSNNTANHVVEKIEFKANSTAGSSVLRTGPFLWFFIPNMVAFSSSFLLTCFVLLTLVSGFFAFVLMLSLSTLLFCLLDSAVLIISPNDSSSKILFCFVYILVYITYLAIAPVVIPKIRRFFR
ncbi:hypothetical protein PTKIN_Ptkin16aG0494000 [Pterospermum kingtungense]